MEAEELEFEMEQRSQSGGGLSKELYPRQPATDAYLYKHSAEIPTSTVFPHHTVITTTKGIDVFLRLFFPCRDDV